jgi:carboxymethylenebutenolidase
MTERDIRMGTPDGPMDAFVAHPDGEGPFPVVVVYMAAPGLTDALRGIGRRLAGEGYYAVAPDLYHRFGDGITFGPDDRDAMMEMLGRLSDDMVLRDTKGVLAFLDGDARAAAAPLGCIGFCMGGRFVVRAVSAFPERFAAGTALHPTALLQDSPDSPHLGLSSAQAELYFGFGGADAIVPPAHQDAVREQVDAHGLVATVDVHDGAEHGFMLPGPRYQEAAAERSWERTLELFGRALQETPRGPAAGR